MTRSPPCRNKGSNNRKVFPRARVESCGSTPTGGGGKKKPKIVSGHHASLGSAVVGEEIV